MYRKQDVAPQRVQRKQPSLENYSTHKKLVDEKLRNGVFFFKYTNLSVFAESGVVGYRDLPRVHLTISPKSVLIVGLND